MQSGGEERVCTLSRSSCIRLFATPWTISSVHKILQARKLEWVAVPFSRGSAQPRDRTPVSLQQFFATRATWEPQRSKECSKKPYLVSPLGISGLARISFLDHCELRPKGLVYPLLLSRFSHV